MRVCLTLALCLVLTSCAWNRGGDINFKFITSGQAVDDGLVVSRVIQGLTLKPAAPSDAKVFRDAQSNALVQWRRRGRINYHWRDRAGVPLSEEAEWYEIEALNGSTVVNTYRVPISQAQPIQWQEDIGSNFSNLTYATDGSGTVWRNTLVNGTFPNLVSKQIIADDFVFECETYNDGTTLYNLPSSTFIESTVGPALVNIGSILTTSTPPFNNTALIVAPTSVRVAAAAGDKFVISHIHGETKVYKNPTSDQSTPLVVNADPDVVAPYRLRVIFDHNNNNGIQNPMLLRFTTPDWTYTAAMQTADGLTPGSAIHLRIYQTSAVSGRGLPLDITL